MKSLLEFELFGGVGMRLISLYEYAKIHGRDPATVRQKALRGGFRTAKKIGRNWLIDKNEPYIDLRTKKTPPGE